MNASPTSPDCGTCPGRIVCRCLRVTEQAILDALNVTNLNTIKELREHTGAGDGCTACHRALRRYLELRVLQSSSAEPICSVR